MSVRATGEDVGEVSRVRERIKAKVVGRERELDLVLAAVATGRDIVLEGPPGTSKTTLLRAITREWGVPLVFVEGNADLTPAKLLGHHNPARVLREDYTADNFVDGPLLTAMREGGFLYIEEFNRAPEDTLNTLLTAMADREVSVARLGLVKAAPTFRVVASMNPYDNVGTNRLSTSVKDRMCRLAIDYQDEAAELAIVEREAEITHHEVSPELAAHIRRDSVLLTRATRDNPDIRQGSSVRGAIDLTLVAGELLALRAIVDAGTGRIDLEAQDHPRTRYAEAVWDAMTVTLSGRIHLDDTTESSPEGVLRQIWLDHFLLAASAAAPG